MTDWSPLRQAGIYIKDMLAPTCTRPPPPTTHNMSEHRPNTSPSPEGYGPAIVPADARPTTDFNPAPPSETVQPTKVSTPHQQGTIYTYDEEVVCTSF